ncbi:MAG: hypothetical protein GY811_15180 [Myxococcales bacterium]|nr:hypothetical protein [Myxococcales bacterium]
MKNTIKLAAFAPLFALLIVGCGDGPVTSVPEAASELAAVAPTAAPLEVTLTWTDNSDDEAGFRLQRSTLPGGSFADITTTGADVVSFVDDAVELGTDYEYRVVATNADGDAAPSNVASASLPPLANAASGLAAVLPLATPPQAQLSWTDNSSDETGFKVQRGPTGGTMADIATTAADVTYYEDTTVVMDTVYDYQVVATNALGDGQASNLISVDVSTPMVTTVAGSPPASGSTSGYVDGPANTPSLVQWRTGIAIDAAGNVYVADGPNHAIRKIDAVTGDLVTIAGIPPATGPTSGFEDGAATVARFDSPYGTAIDSAGNIYVADKENHAIRKIDAATGNVSTIAGALPGTGPSAGFVDGAATAARFNRPFDVAVDSAGDIYVADRSNHAIRKIDALTGDVSTIAGGSPEAGPSYGFADGSSAVSRLNFPRCLSVDSAGNIFIADTNNYAIRMVDALSGDVSTIAGDGPTMGPTSGFIDGDATTARFSYPRCVAVDSAGNLFVTDGSSIRKIDASTGDTSTIAGDPPPNGPSNGFEDGDGPSARFSDGVGVDVDSNGSTVWVGDGKNSAVRRYGR